MKGIQQEYYHSLAQPVTRQTTNQKRAKTDKRSSTERSKIY